MNVAYPHYIPFYSSKLDWVILHGYLLGKKKEHTYVYIHIIYIYHIQYVVQV